MRRCISSVPGFLPVSTVLVRTWGRLKEIKMQTKTYINAVIRSSLKKEFGQDKFWFENYREDNDRDDNVFEVQAGFFQSCLRISITSSKITMVYLDPVGSCSNEQVFWSEVASNVSKKFGARPVAFRKDCDEVTVALHD